MIEMLSTPPGGLPPTLRWVEGGVTAARGFLASGVSAGIKRSRKPDLSLVLSQTDAVAVGVLTRNRVKAAPVLISHERLANGQARAVLLNSGCANCMTGRPGHQDALRLGRLVARGLHLGDAEVLLASTGLIGRRLPVPRMERAVPALIDGLARSHHRLAAQAILTTDLRSKEAAVEARIRGRVVRMGGMAKGSGMIAPSMATMLGVITTDVVIDAAVFHRLLQDATERTFNKITVDGDMSTNDCVFALANGQSAVVAKTPAERRVVADMLLAVSMRLAALIVEDGEGVARVAEVIVESARTVREAEACAKQIANSPLVKTMLAGGDPNVGRIAAAAGASGARFDGDKLDLWIGRHLVVRHGVARHVGTAVLRSLIAQPRVTMRVALNAGTAKSGMLTCDLTKEYVRINAGYAT